jgi:hypothetical protein
MRKIMHYIPDMKIHFWQHYMTDEMMKTVEVPEVIHKERVKAVDVNVAK